MGPTTRHASRIRIAAPLLLAASLCSPGCSSDDASPTPVQSSSFYQPVANQGAVQAVSTPAATQPALSASPALTTNPPPAAIQTASSPVVISEPPRTPRLTEQSVAQAATAPAAPKPPRIDHASSLPAPTRVDPAMVSQVKATPITTGTYMTIGGVLAEVNGVPIFAARVMRELEPILSARAKELDLQRFEMESSNLIQRQINEFVSEELEYASAQRSLDTDDKKLADALTTDYRQKKIIEAGGSLEQAKRLAAEQGNNFEDQIRQRNRLYLIQIYYQKKVLPRVQITTGDLRDYYAQNVDKVFTEKSEATFRLIRVDPRRVGGKEQALTRIKALRDRANSEDFAQLASSSNDDGSLARSAGKVGPIARNTLAMEKVEEAVFRLEPGQVSEIIEDRGGFYIAKLESKKTGSVKPFDDPAVQSKISEELRRLQVAQMREQIRAELEKNAIVRRDPRMLQTAIEMATQRYPLWRNRT